MQHTDDFYCVYVLKVKHGVRKLLQGPEPQPTGIEYGGITPGARRRKLRYVSKRLIECVEKVVCHQDTGMFEVIQNCFLNVL